MPDHKFDFPMSMVKEDSDESRLLSRLQPEHLPRHIAVIMDGNGRWAKQRGKIRTLGHREGVRSVREIIENCRRLGIEVLTLYAFSSENWKRPEKEVKFLMETLSEFLQKEARKMAENDIRFLPIGRWRELPPRAVADLEKSIELTKDCKTLTVQVALNYGSRAEIVDSMKNIADKVKNGKIDIDDIDEALIADNLYTAGLPDPDLMIRTSGEMRISNYLLWQIAYSELKITDIYWPDFKLKHLLEALVEFQGRERRFGGLKG